LKDQLYTAEMIENAALTGGPIEINGRSFAITQIDATAPAAPAPATAPAKKSYVDPAQIEAALAAGYAATPAGKAEAAKAEASLAEQARIEQARATARAFNAARHGRKLEAPAPAHDEDPRISEARTVARTFGAARRNGAQPRADHKILSRG
jgi:hypothetical protein